MLEKNYMGLDGFVWWMGVVENRQDPLHLGRCQVRFYGIHSDSLSDIPSADLPWAIPVHSLNSHIFSTPKETDVVFGFFADGDSRQMPVMVGIVPGYQTNPKNSGIGYNDMRDNTTLRYSPKLPVSRTYNTDGSGITLKEADTSSNSVLESLKYPRDYDTNNNSISGVTRYDLMANNVISDRKNNLDSDVQTANSIQWSEPYPAYNPLYPYNQAIETESGHVFEMDDTPRNERISMNHRSGTYFEMFPDGAKVEKITKSNYQIIMADDHLHVMGHVYITIDSDARIKVLGDVNLEIGNDLNAQVSGAMNLTVKEALNIKADSLNIDIAQDATLVTGGDQFFTSDGDINLNASGGLLGTAGGDVDINSGGDSNIQAGGDFNAIGSLINLNSGGSAATAATGSGAGLSDAPDRSKKNDAKVPDEETPVPLQYKISGNTSILDPYTGTAVVQNSYLSTDPTDPDGPGKAPDTVTPPPKQECNYNPGSKTFLPSSSWSLGSQGLALIQKSEGYADSSGRYGAKPPYPTDGSVKAYPDPATGAQPYTIGYGTTGPAVDQTITLDTVISKDTATQYLNYSINKKFLPKLKQLVTVDMTQEMVDACLSLMYNIGPGNFAKSSLLSKINSQDWCGAGDAFLSWNKAAGKVLPGLTSRRQSERTLFLS